MIAQDCKECAKTFRTAGDIMKHPRVHTREKPFRAFSVTNGLKLTG
jgi:hypothetical protein